MVYWSWALGALTSQSARKRLLIFLSWILPRRGKFSGGASWEWECCPEESEGFDSDSGCEGCACKVYSICSSRGPRVTSAVSVTFCPRVTDSSSVLPSSSIHRRCSILTGGNT